MSDQTFSPKVSYPTNPHDTPRTDALYDKSPTAGFWWPDLARELERELAAERAAREQAESELGRINTERAQWMEKAQTEEARWRDELIAAREARDGASVERDALKLKLEAAKTLLKHISKDTVLVDGQKYFPTARAEEAREALSQLNTP